VNALKIRERFATEGLPFFSIHAHQGSWRNLRALSETGRSGRRINVVAENGLPVGSVRSSTGAIRRVEASAKSVSLAPIGSA
jgi:hypothetical protein